MKDSSDRLRELRIKKGFETAIDAAKAFGWNENTYKSHENGARGINFAAARRYAAAYGSTANYIMSGEATASPVVQQVASVHLEGVVSAGVFRDSDWKPDDSTVIPAVVRKGIPIVKQYAVRVDGPSVNRRIPDGMYAICAEFDAYPGGATLGSLVHVTRERGGEIEHTIKEIRYTKDGMILMPVSDHPDFQNPIPLKDEDGVEIVIKGVVIGSYQPF